MVAVDIAKRNAWYAWHLDLFKSPSDVFDSKADTLTIRIPESNKLNEQGWDFIRSWIKKHFGSLQTAINEANLSSRLLPALNLIATAVGNLVKLSNTPPPENPPSDYQGMSVMLEQLQHRDILSAVSHLLKYIDPRTDAYRQIELWKESYEATALTAHPRLKELPSDNNIPAGLELAFAPKLMKEARLRLIEAGIDMIRLLTRSNHGHNA